MFKIDLEKNNRELDFLLKDHSIDIDFDIELCDKSNAFLIGELSFENCVTDLSVQIDIDSEVAKHLLLSSCIIFFDKLSKEKQDEIKDLFIENHIDFDKFNQDLTEDFTDYLVDNVIDDISSDFEIDDVMKMLEHHIKSLLEGNDDRLSSALDNKIIAQISFNKDLEKKYLDALLKNQDIIKDKSISDWIADFSKNISGEYHDAFLAKGLYINNLKNLEKEDKVLLSEIFDIYLRLKFFPNSLKDMREGEWFIIPCTKVSYEEFTEGKKIDKEDVIDFVKSDIKGLFENAQIANEYLIELLFDNGLKKELERYISNNQELISKKDFFLNNETSQPNVSNWIKDYINNVGIDKYDDLALLKFVTDSSNTRSLNAYEKDMLYKILKLYLNIKFFPEIFKGVPEDKWNVISQEEKFEQKPKIIQKVFESEPIKEEVKIEKPKNKPIDNLLDSYKDLEKKIIELEKNIGELDVYKNNLNPFFTVIEEDVKNKQKPRLMLEIIFLCKNKLLPLFIKNNANFLIEFKKYLTLKFDTNTIENIVQRPDSIETVSLYLQFLFSKFGLTPKESGLFGMYIANIFKKSGQEKYFPIVYGDTNLERFIFRDIVDEAGTLKLK